MSGVKYMIVLQNVCQYDKRQGDHSEMHGKRFGLPVRDYVSCLSASITVRLYYGAAIFNPK